MYAPYTHHEPAIGPGWPPCRQPCWPGTRVHKVRTTGTAGLREAPIMQLQRGPRTQTGACSACAQTRKRCAAAAQPTHVGGQEQTLPQLGRPLRPIDTEVANLPLLACARVVSLTHLSAEVQYFPFLRQHTQYTRSPRCSSSQSYSAASASAKL